MNPSWRMLANVLARPTQKCQTLLIVVTKYGKITINKKDDEFRASSRRALPGSASDHEIHKYSISAL